MVKMTSGTTTHQRFEELCEQDAQLSHERNQLLVKLRTINQRLRSIDQALQDLTSTALATAPSVEALRQDRNAQIFAAAELMLQDAGEMPATDIASACRCEPHGFPRILGQSSRFEKFTRGTPGNMRVWFRLAAVRT